MYSFLGNRKEKKNNFGILLIMHIHSKLYFLNNKKFIECVYSSLYITLLWFYFHLSGDQIQWLILTVDKVKVVPKRIVKDCYKKRFG